VTADAWGSRGVSPALLLELVAQAALLLEGGDADLGRSGFLAGLSDFALERLPEPGDVLDVVVRPAGSFGGVTRFSAEITSGGERIARGEVTVKREAAG
jgi:hypothetical protein